MHNIKSEGIKFNYIYKKKSHIISGVTELRNASSGVHVVYSLPGYSYIYYFEKYYFVFSYFVVFLVFQQ